MLKTVVIWLLLQPMGIFCPIENGQDACPTVTNLHKLAETSSSFSMEWDAVGAATNYKVWNVRHSDGATLSSGFTSGTSYTFINLTPGAYTFFVAAVCGEERSDFIGIEDVLEI